MDRIILIHLSDVHFGSRAYGNPIWIRPAKYVANGHHNQLVNGFMQLWQLKQSQLRTALGLSSNDDLHVIVTGDLTRVGSVGDFKLAWDFFNNDWSPPTYIPPPGMSVAGLRLGLPKAAAGAGSPGPLPAIPGNHDQWAGSWWLFAPAYTPHGFVRYIGPTHWHMPHVVTSRNKGLRLEIYGLDSNSGLQGMQFQPFQGGEIAPAQLQALDHALNNAGPPANGVLRIVLCHHGFDHFGGPLAPLASTSRDELLRIAADHDVSVILTGHSHYVDYNRWPTNNLPAKQPSKPVWEIRSTTPFQGPPPNLSLPASQFPGPRTRYHGFLVHDVSLQRGQKATWKVHEFLWNPAKGTFAHYGPVNIALP